MSYGVAWFSFAIIFMQFNRRGSAYWIPPDMIGDSQSENVCNTGPLQCSKLYDHIVFQEEMFADHLSELQVNKLEVPSKQHEGIIIINWCHVCIYRDVKVCYNIPACGPQPKQSWYTHLPSTRVWCFPLPLPDGNWWSDGSKMTCISIGYHYFWAFIFRFAES